MRENLVVVGQVLIHDSGELRVPGRQPAHELG
jgi:hypothetical protein